MGKKSQQHQRTKGNLQASSSSRAAQLLQSKSAHVSPTLGFVNKDDALTLAVDSSIASAFRRLNKKESITKQKALIEILELISEENAESSLPLWTRHFSKIAIDSERKVRELALQVHSKITANAGRNLAPYLTTIMGMWLEATCDVNSATAQTAHTSIVAAFPGDKLNSAISFCEKGIIKHIRERLGASAATLSDLKITDPVEAEEKYSRVIGSTLRMIVQVMLTTQKHEMFTPLLADTVIWGLGRSNNQQTRKHVYTFITELTRDQHLPRDLLPEAACKLIVQKLNQCSHETSPEQYLALTTVLQSDPGVFMGCVSAGDLRGQLLDTIRGKAAAAGVTEKVFSQLQIVVPILYKHWIDSEDNSKWYKDVLTATTKCLGICRTTNDTLIVLNFTATIADSVCSQWAGLFPDERGTTGNLVTSIIPILTSNILKPELLPNLTSLVMLSPPETTNLTLSKVALNQHRAANITTLVCALVRTEAVNADEIFRYLAKTCKQELQKKEYEFVESVLSGHGPVSAMLFTELTEHDAPEVALINMANGIFIPHFANPEMSDEKIVSLCKLFVCLLKSSDKQPCNICSVLIDSCPKRSVALRTFLEQQLSSSFDLLPIGNIIREFESLDGIGDEDIICSIARIARSSKELSASIALSIIESLQKPEIGPKAMLVLNNMRWDASVETIDEILRLLLLQITSLQSLLPLMSSIKNFVNNLPHSSTPVYERLIELLKTTENNDESSDGLISAIISIFSGHPDFFISQVLASLPAVGADNARLMSLNMEHEILIDPKFSSSTKWTNGQTKLLEAATSFISQHPIPINIDDATAKIVSHNYFMDNRDQIQKLLQFLSQNHALTHDVINSLLWEGNSIVVCLLKDLSEIGYIVDWNGLEGHESFSTTALTSIVRSTAQHEAALSVLASRETDGIGICDKLCYLELKTFTLGSVNLPEIVEFLSESCLDSQVFDLKLATAISPVFQKIFLSPTSTEEDMEFVLCSTATVVQNVLEAVHENLSSDEQYYLETFFCSFQSLYLSVHELIWGNERNLQKIFAEDWDQFFQPGIQDLILLLHDKILSYPFGIAARSLAQVVQVAPAASVKSFARNAVRNSEDLTFDECYRYLSGCENWGCYQIQSSLFYITLHCQKLFPTEEGVQSEDQFAAPPQLLLSSLPDISFKGDLALSDEEMVRRIVDLVQVWVLILVHETIIPVETLKEHVEYLRSKQVISQVLDIIAPSPEESTRKCDITLPEQLIDGWSEDFGRLKNTCLLGIATIFPALLRNWWQKLNKEMSTSVGKFVAVNLSPKLIKMETNIRESGDDTLTIKPRPLVREVVATYTMDDISADLIIHIAPNHPLTPPSVSCERQIGVPVGTWRFWMLQMTAMFSNQNSSIVEALQQWRSNMDKQFEGIESCMICFSVVQGPKKALPKPTCRTCKKRFHSACLFKWFSTSGKSTCPMCRSPFQQDSRLRSRLQEGNSEDD